MIAAPEPWLDPPPEPVTSECDDCARPVPRGDLWQIRRDCLCLDCAVQPAVDLLAGPGRGVSPAEIELARDAIVLWAATASGEHLRRLEQTARAVMFAPPTFPLASPE